MAHAGVPSDRTTLDTVHAAALALQNPGHLSDAKHVRFAKAITARFFGDRRPRPSGLAGAVRPPPPMGTSAAFLAPLGALAIGSSVLRQADGERGTKRRLRNVSKPGRITLATAPRTARRCSSPTGDRAPGGRRPGRGSRVPTIGLRSTSKEAPTSDRPPRASPASRGRSVGDSPDVWQPLATTRAKQNQTRHHSRARFIAAYTLVGTAYPQKQKHSETQMPGPEPEQPQSESGALQSEAELHFLWQAHCPGDGPAPPHAHCSPAGHCPPSRLHVAAGDPPVPFPASRTLPPIPPEPTAAAPPAPPPSWTA
jgi:hypothetical protein